MAITRSRTLAAGDPTVDSEREGGWCSACVFAGVEKGRSRRLEAERNWLGAIRSLHSSGLSSPVVMLRRSPNGKRLARLLNRRGGSDRRSAGRERCPYQISRQWHASDDRGSAGQTQRGQPERPPYQRHAWDDRGAAGQTHRGQPREETAPRWTQLPPSRDWSAFQPEAVGSTSQLRSGGWSHHSW